MKTMNKEECNNFVIFLLAWIARFTPHIFLMLQHNLVKEGSKDQLIFNATECPTKDVIPVILSTSIKDRSELDFTFGTVMMDLIIHLWNLVGIVNEMLTKCCNILGLLLIFQKFCVGS